MSLRSLYPNVVFLKLNDVILNAKHLTKSSLFGGRDDKNLKCKWHQFHILVLMFILQQPILITTAYYNL